MDVDDVRAGPVRRRPRRIREDRPAADARSAAPASSFLEHVACHRDPRRSRSCIACCGGRCTASRGCIDDAADDDVVTLTRMREGGDRSRHKMTAFVRFREVVDGERLALRRVVRSRARRAAAGGAVFRDALRHDALDDRDARRHRALGSARRSRSTAPDPRSCRPRTTRRRRSGSPTTRRSSIRRGST